MKTAQYLAAVKAKLQISSDYELARRLMVSRTRISNYRTGYSTFDNEMAAKVAELLEIPAIQVIADAELERGSDRELWKRIGQKVAGVLVPAALAIGAASFGVAPSPAQAAGSNGVIRGAPAGLCIMSNRRRRARSWWWSAIWP